METQSITQTKDLVKIFAAAVQEKAFDQIASLLADNGNFQTQDAKLETIVNCSKAAFMEWFIPALSTTIIDKIEYDNCILCKMGAPVIIFNDGLFPKVKNDASRKSMNGLMLEIENGLIKGISICYAYAIRENKYQFERDGEEMKKLMEQIPGMTIYEAVEIVLTRKGQTDIWGPKKDVE